MIRTNTVEYGWETSNATTVSSSFFTSETKTITLPETQSRTFLSVGGILYARNSGTELTTGQASYSIAIQIDNNPTASFQNYDSIVNQTAEHFAFQLPFDYVAYFNTYFTSSQHAVKFIIQSPNTNTIGASFKLFCTYTFNDATVNESIKTIRLPINSVTGSVLTSQLQYLGNYTASIPVLDTFLPEIGKTYRDIFIEYHGNDASSATTNFELRSKIDTATSASRFTVSQSLQSAAAYYEIQTLSGSIDTATTHSIQVASSLTNRFTGLGGILHCTYTYNYTGSSTVLNSLIYSLGKPDTHSSRKSVVRNKLSSYSRRIYIPESNIVTCRSGVYFSTTGPVPVIIEMGTNDTELQQLTYQAGTIQTGYVPTILQIDKTGSVLGPIGLQSGYNNISIYVEQQSALVSNIWCGAYLLLNYYSDVISAAPLANSHTIKYLLTGSLMSSAGSLVFFYMNYYASASISESRYFIGDVHNEFFYAFGAAANVPIYNNVIATCFYTASDFYHEPEANPTELISVSVPNDSRILTAVCLQNMTAISKKYPEFNVSTSKIPKLNISEPHLYSHRLINVTTNAKSLLNHYQLLTYHSRQFSITGSIQNYSGSGIIPLTIYDYDTGDKLFVTQSKLGGVIDTYWYDWHTNLMLVAETGSRYVSNVLPAGSGSFSIVIPTTGAPPAAEKSFTFIG